MNKLLLTLILGALSTLGFSQNAPSISYSGSAQVYTTGVAITPLTPVNSGGSVTGGTYGATSTFAGNGTIGSSNGSATTATFFYPSGVVLDNAGNMYIADQYNNLIRKITPAGVVTTIAGGYAGFIEGTGTSAEFNNPCNTAVDAAGNIYVTDRYNNRIRKITPAGVVSTLAGNGNYSSIDGTGTAASFYYPYGITIDASGNLYVTEQYGERIRKVTPAGVVTTIAGSGSLGSVNGTGTAASFNNPTGIILDPAGNLYIAENTGHDIRKITPAGVVTTIAGTGVAGFANGSATTAQFNQPTSIAIDAAGNLYVADQANNMIRVISTAGMVSTLAGNTVAGSANGIGTAAGFSRPTGVTVNAANAYVADYINNEIRAINLSGYNISPALPDGLTFNSQTGAISGTPTSVSPATTYTITAQNTAGVSATTISIAVAIPAVPPVITTFSPMATVPNAAITITGNNFLGATAVSIGGKPATSFSVLSFDKISAIVPAGATSGSISVTNPYGTITQSGLVVTVAPNIAYTTPHSYVTGAAITALSPTNTGGAVTAGIYSQVTTLAGSGTQQTTNGTGTAASFNYPTGMVTDAQGNIYVAETYGNVIRKITPAGVVTTFAGTGITGTSNGAATAATFSGPVGLALDPAGNMFVADRSNNLIRKITPAGIVSTFAGNGAYNYIPVNGTGTAAGFNNPTALVTDALGNIYVADAGSNAIRKITTDAVVTTLVSGTLNSPSGITIDGSGNLYFTDRGNNMVKKITPAGVISILAGNGVSASVDGPGTSASFISPTNITIDPSGNLYVTENAGLIRMITPAGVVTTLAGKSSANTSTDGIGTNATFYSPWGIAADVNGNLYVSDQFSNKIRKISITGYSVKPALPSGLSLANTGTISGTPMVVTTATDYLITAVNIAGTSTATVNIATPIPALPPTITSISPTATGYGKTITITGTNLLGATSVKIGTVDVPFASISPFTLNVLINTPTAGSISVTNPYGTATSSAISITQPPVITYTTGNIFTVGTAITNLSPTNTGDAIPNSVYGQTSTFAGNGTYGNVNGTGTAAVIASPQGLVVDASNNIYITDAYSQIRKITPAGVVTTIAGNGSTGFANGPGTSAIFNYPKGLAIDIAGNIYVADNFNHQIRKITPAGDVTTLAGSGSQGASNGTGSAASFNYPTGVAVDINGNVFVADKNNNLIRKITPQGVVSTFAGNGTAGASNGTGTAATFSSPAGLAFDPAGNLYVADANNGLIRKITPAGVVTTYAGSTTGYGDGTVTTAKFNNPFSLVVNSNGDVYVGDRYNSDIRKITADGTVTTIAGNGTNGSKNGIGQDASFTHPEGVGLDSYGNLFVADVENSLVRKVITTGYTITPALPDGLTFDNSTGIISGTPNVSLAGAPKFRVYGSNSAGTSTTTFDITIKIPAAAPVITSITPASAGVNNTITITGTNFTDATAVEIGGATATYRVVSPTTMIALVGAGSTGSNIKITNAYGNGTFSGFTFTPAPTIAYTGPQTYKTGTAITPLNITRSGSAIPNNLYGKTTTIAGGPNLPAANLYQLIGVVADANGNTFAISSTSNVIYKITAAGVVSVFAGSTNSGFTNGVGTAASFYSPKAITIDADGNLYVLDPNNYAIRKITPQAVVSTYATYLNIYNGAGTTSDIKSFVTPAGITIDKLGNVFVSDTYFSRISKITSAGVITTIAGSGSTGAADGAGATATFNSPQGLATDNLGNIYVADTYNNKIRKIAPDGTVSTLAGSGTQGNANGTGTAASFTSPSALTVDASGNVYTAESANNLIRKITPNGVVSTLAGSGRAGFVNETGTAANFNSPSAIFSDGTGNVYVADAGNSAIRKVATVGYTVSPALPAGLTIDETGSINGTPTDVSTAKDYTITAYNNAGQGTATVNIGVVVPTVAPVITAFTQASQNPGSGVTITGNNFIGATAVNIGGIAAASFTIISPTIINAYASPNAVSGSVKVTNPYGDATQAGLTFNTAPQIAYTGTLNFTAGTAITPVIPTNSGSAIPALPYGQFTTIAGTGSSGSANGTGTAASFSSLNGTVIDQSGNIFVADGNLIRKITSAGVVTTFADLTLSNNSGISTSQLSGLVIDASGNLFVADKFNSLIRKVTPAGVVSTFVGTGNYYASNDGTGTQASIYQPSGIAIDIAGNLYVTESGIGNYKIRKITPAGVVTTLAGSSVGGSLNGTGMAASFNYPNGIVIDFYGNLYIADTNNNLIRKVTPTGVVTVFAGSGTNGSADGTGTAASFSNPYWLTIDASGDLYVSDAAGLSIRKINPTGVVTTIAKLSAPTTGTYYSSGSLSIDASGNLVMADMNNHLLRKFSLSGYSITPALPTGFAFDGATGTISGTPQYVATTPLTYNVTGYNAVGSNTTTVSFTVGVPAAPQISYAASQSFTVATRITDILPTNTGGGIPEIGYGKTTTVAGNGNYDYVNGTATNASFAGPTGIVVDNNNNIFVGQIGHAMIRKITPDGTVSTYTGLGNSNSTNGPIASADFESILGLTINSKGDMFATDGNGYVGYAIRKISGGTVSTLAGDAMTPGYVDGTGTAAKFNVPYQIAADNNDNLYVADRSNNVIRKITPAGVVTTFAGTGVPGAADGNSNAATFKNPDGVVVDANGNLYVADTQNNLIRKISSTGIVSTFAGSGASGSADGTGTAATFNHPTGLVLDGLGNLYVADYDNNLIRKITSTGIVSTVAGNGQKSSTDGSGKSESFNNPFFLTMSNDKNSLYVSDFSGNVIRKVELYGYTIDKQLPDGLFFNGATGKIYGIPRVASPATNYTITAVNAGGSSASTISIGVAAVLPPNIAYPTPQQLLINAPVKIVPTNTGGAVPAAEYGLASTFAGSGVANSADGSAATAGFHTPMGMVSDKLGNIYVADQGNNKIRKVTPEGTVSTFVGNGNAYGTDGKGTLASIGSPTGIAIDSRGYLFVTDRYNGNVRQVKPDGTTSIIYWIYFDGNITYSDYTPMPLNNPYGITKDAYGNLYITDQSYHTIRKATYQNGFSAYVLSVFAGTGSPGSTNGIGSAASFNQPAGITSDAAGNVYVADRGNNLIRKITPTGVVTTFAGSGTAGSTNGTGTAASFNQPTDLTMDAAGNLYVVDQGNNMIRMITADGVVTTFSGNTTSGFLNSYGTASQYKTPTGIAFDPTGKLYVSDNNNVIRNVVTTGFTYKTLPQGISFGGITGTLSDAPTVLSPPTNYTVTAYNYAGKSTATINLSVVSKIDQVITFPLVANPTYGDDDVALNATSTGTTLPLNYTTVNTNVATIVNGKLHIIGAGVVTVTVSQAGDATHNAAGSITQAITINPKAITVTANALSKTYGDADPAFTYTITSGSLVGTDAFTGNMYKDQGENAGIYNINQGTLALNGNYKLTFTGNKFTINKKPLTATALDVTWSYGRVTSNLPVQYSGFAFADDVTKLTAQPVVTTAANPSALVPGVYDLVPGNGVADNYSFVYVNGKLTVTLPSTSFKIASTSVTCKGSNNGIITITPTSALNYTAVVTGGGLNQTYHFNSTLTIGSLAPATYHVCVSADNLPGDQQCSDVIITEPKDLAVYATVNKTVNTVTLALSGSDNYTVKINGTEYQTSGSSITLPLNKGSNKISVNTDKPCQGSIEQMIDLSGITAPYPNPFQSVLYVNLGESISASATISIFNMADGRQVLNQKFNNMSGVVRLDVASLKTGVYTLNLTLDGKLSTFKIVKQ